jgi:hypothetical protein
MERMMLQVVNALSKGEHCKAIGAGFCAYSVVQSPI